MEDLIFKINCHASFFCSPSYKGDTAIVDDRQFTFLHVENGAEHVNHLGSYGNVHDASVVVPLNELHQNFDKKQGGP